MNERIRELVRESNLDVYGLGKERYRWEYTVEKFAELIVRECIDYCGENLSKTVGGALKIHFGVEQDVNETLRNRSTYFGNDI